MKRSINWVAKVLQVEGVYPTQLLDGVSIDTRTITSNQLYIPLCGERFDGHDFYQVAIDQGCSAMLWQKNHPLPRDCARPVILVEDTLKALQKLATAYRQELSCQVIGITGSNGKTTTKDMIASVLSEKYKVQKTQGNLNNHIGLPLTILSFSEDTEVAVVEMGMNHAGEIALLSRIAQPHAAVITNIGDAHIEFFGSRKGIAEAKLEILAGLATTGVVVYDEDEPLLHNPLAKMQWELLGISWDQMDWLESKDLSGWEFSLKTEQSPYQLPLLGKHNIKNAMMAIRIGTYFGCDHSQIASGFQQMAGTAMRLEMKTAKNGMKIIDDTYNANPTSVRASLQFISDLNTHLKRWVLLGDMSEIGDMSEMYHQEVGLLAIQLGLDRILTIGDSAYWIYEAAKKKTDGISHRIQHFSSKEEAAIWLHNEGNDQVMLLAKASRAAALDQIVNQLMKGV